MQGVLDGHSCPGSSIAERRGAGLLGGGCALGCSFLAVDARRCGNIEDNRHLIYKISAC